ncbi:MAG: single-stranded DNA-binding protein [Candidatus Heimdallarchaeaceae archaeon]
MKVEELQPESNFDSLKVRVISKEGPRQVQGRSGVLYVWDILVIDETGSTTLTLWGADTGEQYKIGQVITIENGWCKMFRDQKQISLGREGKMNPSEDDPTIPTKLPG